MVSSAPAPDPRIDERVVELLTESGGTIAFNGLRRTLGAHPESLARALKRLQRHGVVVRDAGGYGLHPDVAAETAGSLERPAAAVREIGAVAVPVGARGDAVLGHLVGRWWGPLRWVGVYDLEGQTWLGWSVGRGPAELFLTVADGAVRALVADGATVASRSTLEDGARRLLGEAIRRLPSFDGAAGSIRTYGATVTSPLGSANN